MKFWKWNYFQLQVRSENEIISTGRNGLIAFWNCKALRLGIPFKTIRSGLEWPINLRLNGETLDQGTRILGFQASKFRIISGFYSGKNRIVNFESECGGGHRSWTFWSNCENEFNLGFIKKGNVFIESNREKGNVL